MLKVQYVRNSISDLLTLVKEHSLKKGSSIIKNYFPNAVVVPFVESYFAIAKAFLPTTKTEHQWMLSSKVDYTGFDFDYIASKFRIYGGLIIDEWAPYDTFNDESRNWIATQLGLSRIFYYKKQMPLC